MFVEKLKGDAADPFAHDARPHLDRPDCTSSIWGPGSTKRMPTDYESLLRSLLAEGPTPGVT